MTDNGGSGLSQNDFRKMMAVPRSVANTTNESKKRWKPNNAEDESKNSGYRDRALERREGINNDYKATEQILHTLQTGNDDTMTAVEKSKYFGGDVEHTHLVKGLDFQLLQKVKKDIMEKTHEEIEAEAYVASLHDMDAVPTFSSKLAETIYNECITNVRQLKIKSLQRPRQNELFIPGRMAFVWELGFAQHSISGGSNTAGSMVYNGSDDLPTSIIRSRSDAKVKEIGDTKSEGDKVVLDMVGKVFEMKRNQLKQEKKEKKEREEKLEQELLNAANAARNGTTTVKPAKPVEKVQLHFDDDDDIFADAGRDYVLTVEPSRAAEFKPEEYTLGPELGPARPPMDYEDDLMGPELGPARPPMDDEEDDLGPELGPSRPPMDYYEEGELLGPELGPSRPQPIPSTKPKTSYFKADGDEDIFAEITDYEKGVEKNKLEFIRKEVGKEAKPERRDVNKGQSLKPMSGSMDRDTMDMDFDEYDEGEEMQSKLDRLNSKNASEYDIYGESGSLSYFEEKKGKSKGKGKRGMADSDDEGGDVGGGGGGKFADKSKKAKLDKDLKAVQNLMKDKYGKSFQ